MADHNRPDQSAANTKSEKTTAEGERWSSESDTVRNADRDEHPERLYDDEDRDDAGGITNRPLSEEIGDQASLPERGTSRERIGNPDANRPEGDHTEMDR